MIYVNFQTFSSDILLKCHQQYLLLINNTFILSDLRKAFDYHICLCQFPSYTYPDQNLEIHRKGGKKGEGGGGYGEKRKGKAYISHHYYSKNVIGKWGENHIEGKREKIPFTEYIPLGICDNDYSFGTGRAFLEVLLLIFFTTFDQIKVKRRDWVAIDAVVGGVITLSDIICKTYHYSWPG